MSIIKWVNAHLAIVGGGGPSRGLLHDCDNRWIVYSSNHSKPMAWITDPRVLWGQVTAVSAPPPRMRNGLVCWVGCDRELGWWAGSGVAIIIDTINQQTVRKCAATQCTYSNISISVFFIQIFTHFSSYIESYIKVKVIRCSVTVTQTWAN